MIKDDTIIEEKCLACNMEVDFHWGMENPVLCLATKNSWQYPLTNFVYKCKMHIDADETNRCKASTQ